MKRSQRAYSQIQEDNIVSRIHNLEQDCTKLKIENKMLRSRGQDNTQVKRIGLVTNTLLHEVDDGKTKLNQLEKNLDEYKNKNSAYSVVQERLFSQIRDQNNQIHNLKSQVERLEEEKRQLQHQYDCNLLNRKQEGVFQVEVEHLRADNERLVKMLRQTQAFQNLTELGDNSENQLRYLKEANKLSELDMNEKMSKLKSCCNRIDLVDERLLWVPEKVFNIAQKVLVSFNSDMSIQQLELLLFELNKVWSERESQLIRHLKKQAKKNDQEKENRRPSQKRRNSITKPIVFK